MNELLVHGRHLAGPALIVLDLLGTFVFALSGAAAGIKGRLDFFGLMVLANSGNLPPVTNANVWPWQTLVPRSDGMGDMIGMGRLLFMLRLFSGGAVRDPIAGSARHSNGGSKS
jgi:hypothetical protein